MLAIRNYMWRSLLFMCSHVGEDVYRYVRPTVSVSTVINTLQVTKPSPVVGVTFLKSSTLEKIKA